MQTDNNLSLTISRASLDIALSRNFIEETKVGDTVLVAYINIYEIGNIAQLETRGKSYLTLDEGLKDLTSKYQKDYQNYYVVILCCLSVAAISIITIIFLSLSLKQKH